VRGEQTGALMRAQGACRVSGLVWHAPPGYSRQSRSRQAASQAVRRGL